LYVERNMAEFSDESTLQYGSAGVHTFYEGRLYSVFSPLSLPQQYYHRYNLYFLTKIMGRIMPPFRQLYQETISDLTTELKAALVDLGHKSAFDLLLKEAWNPEVAAMGNSTLPTVLDKLNVMSTIHLRKLIATLVRENGVLESRLNEIKQPNTDVV
jgi:hypothetical protein